MPDPPDPVLKAIAAYAESDRPHLLRVHAALVRLSEMRRVAFAACCAERLYLDYRVLAAEIGVEERLRPLLDAAWRHALGRESLTEVEIEDGITACQDVPTGEADSHRRQDKAYGAIDATCHALEACRGDGVTWAFDAGNIVLDKANGHLFELLTDELSLCSVGLEEMSRIDEMIDQNRHWNAEIALQMALLEELGGPSIDRDRLLAMVRSAQPIGDWSLES